MASEGDLKSRLKKPIKKLLRRHRSPSGTPPIADNQSVEQDSAHDASEVSSIAAANSHARPLASVADLQIIQPSTESPPADQPDSIAALQVPCLVIPVEPLHGPAPTGPIEPSEPTSLSQELWNAAYSALEVEEAELVEAYVKTLHEVLGGETGEADATDTLKEMEDPKRRQEYMSELGIVDLTLKAVPQTAPAALPWAGVCLGLEILRNPAREMNSNLEGIAYAISRMDWYCALTELLLNKNNAAGGDMSQGVLSQLKGNIIELYKALLLYQIKSIVSYYRNRVGRFFRDMGKWDDWEGSIQHVKDVEKSIRADIDQYCQGQTKTSLDELSHHANEQTTLLGNIRQDIHSFISQQKAASRNKDKADCRRDLCVVNPQHDMQRIKNNKDQLLDDAYEWIFDTPEYKMFSSWDSSKLESPQPQMLWLKGHAGTGKTMLMIGLIRRFSSQSAALAPAVSFFFCQGTDAKLRNATAVLRSLIWLLLLQQRHLISHLLQDYKDSGASLFTDQNSFVALSEVFKNMLKDDELLPVYFAVDSLDECVENRAELIALISSTLTLSKNVRWLLSSRPEVDVPSDPRAAKSLVEIDTQRPERPVKAYIDYKLNTLKGRKGYGDEVLKEILKIVQERAGNTFLWVALAFKALGEMNSGVDRSEKSMPSDCKKVLKAAFLAFRPLSFSELSIAITGLGIDITEDAVEECGSFFAVADKIVNFIHQSTKDFLKDKGFLSWVEGLSILGKVHDGLLSLKERVRIVETLYGHAAVVSSVAFLPNQKTLASASHDRTVRFYDAATGAHRQTLNPQKSGIHSMAFSRGGETLAITIEDRVQLWNVAARRLAGAVRYQMLEGHTGVVIAVAFSHDGEMLVSGSEDGTIRVWDVATGELQKTIEPQMEHVYAVAFSPDNKTLAVGGYIGGGDGAVSLWDVATGAHIDSFGRDSEPVTAVVFSPDGGILASAAYDRTESFKKLTLRPQSPTSRRFKGHTGSVLAVAFSPDGKTLASGSFDNTVRLWDITAAWPSSDRPGELSDPVTAVGFLPNGKILVSASESGLLRLWDVATAQPDSIVEEYRIDLSPGAYRPTHGMTLAVSSDGTMIAFNLGNGIQIWDRTITSPNSKVLGIHDALDVVFSPDNKMLASVSGDHALLLYDLTATWPERRVLLSKGVWEIAFSPDSKMLASISLGKGALRLWDLTATPPKGRVLLPKGVWEIAFSPDSKMLASFSFGDNKLKFWDLTVAAASLEGKELVKKRGLGKIVFSPNSRILETASGDGTSVQRWGVATGRRPPANDWPSPDHHQNGNPKYRISDNRRWITSNGRPVLLLPGEYRPSSRTNFATCGSIVAIGNEEGELVVLQC
ncbi:hypothetical protein EKO27_g9520 [Xylaria grammica]|uniref:NACHT domain-containing protein n=1 Tax=Xylaria grammica TaxID=363999 RepID=A0A439CTU3_9PEZI|nr:hypothetical protein EKO27_g9520 [Xylaria grammica]